MGEVVLEKCWNTLYGTAIGDANYWAANGKIPLGTLLPRQMYREVIPESDIVTIPFDSASTPFTSRNPCNVLLLAASGDGKSQIMKNAWSVLHDAGYYIAYIDPKSTDSGRAKIAWENSPNLAPNMVPKGIPLQHFMPKWATYNFERFIHNFRIYSIRLDKVNQREMWAGLGMTGPGSSKTAKIIQAYNQRKQRITIQQLMNEIHKFGRKDPVLGRPELTQQSIDAANSRLIDMEDFEVVSENYQEIDLLKEWKAGYSLCFSYNRASQIQMTFDIGMLIHEAANLYDKGNRTPILFFLDDGSLYLRKLAPIVVYNYALQQSMEIGNNYRSLGLNEWVAIQSLRIIDDTVADTFPIKLISPLFQDIDGLSKINIPEKAIYYLKNGLLTVDKENHIIQWLLVDQNRNVIPFYPFTPPCNHFTQIYHEKAHDDTQEMENDGTERPMAGRQDADQYEQDPGSPEAAG